MSLQSQNSHVAVSWSVRRRLSSCQRGVATQVPYCVVKTACRHPALSRIPIAVDD